MSDFWAAYHEVVCALRQMSLRYLLRQWDPAERCKSPGACWPELAKKLWRLVGHALRLWGERAGLLQESSASHRGWLTTRLQELLATPCKDCQAKRLIKPLRRHQNHLFAFLDEPDVPVDNDTWGHAVLALDLVNWTTPMFLLTTTRPSGVSEPHCLSTKTATAAKASGVRIARRCGCPSSAPRNNAATILLEPSSMPWQFTSKPVSFHFCLN